VAEHLDLRAHRFTAIFALRRYAVSSRLHDWYNWVGKQDSAVLHTRVRSQGRRSAEEVESLKALVVCRRATVSRRYLFLAISLTLAGCTNLDEVAALPKLADGAKTTLPILAKDLKGSCDRQNFYADPTDNPAAVHPCSLGTAYAELGKNMISEQSILLAYFDAIGKLAGGSTSGFSKSVSGIDANLKVAGLNTDQQQMASSAGKLAAAIADMITDGYKRKKLGEIVRASNDDVATLTNGLADQIDSNSKASYTEELGAEETSLSTYYGVPIGQAANDPLGKLRAYRDWQSAREKLKARRDAAKAYRQLMESLRDAHAKLKDESVNNHFDAKAIAKALGPHLSDIEASIAEMQKDLR